MSGLRLLDAMRNSIEIRLRNDLINNFPNVSLLCIRYITHHQSQCKTENECTRANKKNYLDRKGCVREVDFEDEFEYEYGTFVFAKC